MNQPTIEVFAVIGMAVCCFAAISAIIGFSIWISNVNRDRRTIEYLKETYGNNAKWYLERLDDLSDRIKTIEEPRT